MLGQSQPQRDPTELSKRIARQEEQASEYVKKYEAISAYVEIGVTRIQFIQDVFVRITQVLREAIQAGNQVFPQIKNEEINSTPYKNSICLFGLFSCTHEEYQQYAETIDTKIVPFLAKLTQECMDELERSGKQVEEAQRLHQVALAQCLHENKNIEKLYGDTVKAYQKYTEIKASQNSKSTQKAHDAVQTAVIAYRSGLDYMSRTTANLNRSYRQFVSTMDEAINEAASVDKKRVHEILVKFGDFKLPIKMISESIKKIRPRIAGLQWEWIPLFQEFITNCSIVRSSLEPIPFVPIQLSFQDGQCPVPKIDVSSNNNFNLDIPIAVKRVSRSFTGNPPIEASVEQNELVFTYELTNNKWTFVSSIDNARRGYVPSVILAGDSAFDVALVVKTHIPNNNDELVVASGEVIIVEERKVEGFLCRNSHGMTGLVPTQCLLTRLS